MLMLCGVVFGQSTEAFSSKEKPSTIKKIQAPEMNKKATTKSSTAIQTVSIPKTSKSSASKESEECQTKNHANASKLYISLEAYREAKRKELEQSKKPN